MEVLEQNNYLFLDQVGDEATTSIFHQGWKYGVQLMLNGDLSRFWEECVSTLRRQHIRLSDSEDVLIWDKAPNDRYSPKAGYLAISVELFNRDVKWWWKGLWKLNCPTKNKLFEWVVLENKVLTWDILQKRHFKCLRWCSLWKNDQESSLHLFLHCSFSKAV